MKKITVVILSIVVLTTIIVTSGFAKGTASCQEDDVISVTKNKEIQTVNLFVTHGHCSTPFAGHVHNMEIITMERDDQGNPLEEMKVSFEIDPNTFQVCAGDEETESIRTPGLFINESGDKITFRSTDVYTMGLNWYQINGKLSIKGIEKSVKLFATGIRGPKEAMATSLVFQGKMNLLDWGIDYDLIVNGKSDPVPTKWLYLNMTVELPGSTTH